MRGKKAVCGGERVELGWQGGVLLMLVPVSENPPHAHDSEIPSHPPSGRRRIMSTRRAVVYVVLSMDGLGRKYGTIFWGGPGNSRWHGVYKLDQKRHKLPSSGGVAASVVSCILPL